MTPAGSPLASLTPTQLADLAALLLDRDDGPIPSPVSQSDISRLRESDESAISAEEQRLFGRVTAWVDASRARFLESLPGPTPAFDHLADFWENFYEGPKASERVAAPRSHVRPTNFLGFELGFPFGVPACALTPQSAYIDFFARRGFDLLTYKTVRDRAWDPHPFPQWAFAVDVDPDLHVTASISPPLDIQPEKMSLVNSFGVPSLPVEQWQEDIGRAKSRLASDQVLIVSVMGSPETLAANRDHELAQQFASTAHAAAEAGADIIEVNLSCPNTGGELICGDADLSAAILRNIRQELKRDQPPILIKVSHLAEPALGELVDACYRLAEGVVAINSVMVPTTQRDGKPFFPNRIGARGQLTDSAGLSGAAILERGLDAVARLNSHRKRLGLSEEDWAIVGVGGVTAPDHFSRYRELGANAVQSCSGAWLNPSLAASIRQTAGRPTLRAAIASVLEPLATGGMSLLTDQRPVIAGRRRD